MRIFEARRVNDKDIVFFGQGGRYFVMSGDEVKCSDLDIDDAANCFRVVLENETGEFSGLSLEGFPD